MANRLLQTAWGKWLLFISGWALLSLLFAPEVYLYFLFRRQPVPWTQTLSMTVANLAVALVFLPLIVWLTRRNPVERQTWPAALAVHVPACLLFAMSHSALFALLCFAAPRLSETLFVRFHPNLLTYWAIVGFTQAVDYFRRYQERERQLAQVQLLLLKNQLHPHFLFNTLHTISAMMHEDVKAADRMVNRLSDLLRMTLDTIGLHEVALRHELDFIRKYTEIEQQRRPDSFELRIEAEPAVYDALVPSMVLQPLIENSIRHGISANGKRGVVTVRAYRQADSLFLQVLDDGRGLPQPGPKASEEGLGLSITRKRLQYLYPGAHRFELAGSASQGTVATMVIPFHTVAAGAEPLPQGEK